MSNRNVMRIISNFEDFFYEKREKKTVKNSLKKTKRKTLLVGTKVEILIMLICQNRMMISHEMNLFQCK